MVINEELQSICNEVIEKYGNSLYTHNIMQYKIKEWADKNNYICDLEYEVEQRDENSKRKGKIDIRIVINEKINGALVSPIPLNVPSKITSIP